MHEKLKSFSKNNFYVICDFDRTLTHSFNKNGSKASTSNGILRDNGYLSEEYCKLAKDIFSIYYPLEKDNSLTFREKKNKMIEWWQKHLEIKKKFGLNKNLIEEVSKKSYLNYREYAKEFLELCFKFNIPVIIFSAGEGDIIVNSLKHEDMLFSNMRIISNFYEFDSDGNILRYLGDIIHSLNKSEVELKGSDILKDLESKENCILIGDKIEDLGMARKEHKAIYSFGFLNEDVEENLSSYKAHFDELILNDGSFKKAYDTLKKILL